MDLERLSVTLRPRTDWEAVDLGIVLVRSDWRRIFTLWSVVMVPILVGTVLALGGWGLLLFWWLLPLGEMVVLFHLSRAVFDSAPPLRETLRAAPGLWRLGLPELFFRRLNPMRSATLAVGQLERLRGADRRARVSVLASVGQGVPSWLPVVFLCFEIGFTAALLVLAYWLLPSGIGFEVELAWERFWEGALPPAAYRLAWMLVGAVVLLFHPFHVASGFALYLDRRTVLEGWDLEIAFRRMGRRLGRLASGSAVVVLCVVGLGFGGVPTVDAQEPPPATWKAEPGRDPRRVAREVMSRPAFQREVTQTRWKVRKGLFDDTDDTNRSPNLFLASLGTLVASLVEPLMWGVAIVLVLLVARALWRALPDTPDAQRRPSRPPERLAGLDVRPESLPDDIPGAAEALWRQGDPAGALSLLYRGALARLGAEGLELRESFTEDDCLRVAGRTLARDRTAFFTELTRAWQRVAYAHRIPEIAQASRLWGEWSRHFSTAGGTG